MDLSTLRITCGSTCTIFAIANFAKCRDTLRYRLESLKHQFYISNVLAHLFFCNRSPNCNESDCGSCSRLFVNDASDFVFSIRYHFTLIFPSNNVFNKDLELLCANLRHFALDVLYQSRTHYALLASNQNKCMYFLVAKQPRKLAVKSSEVLIRILINDIASISNNFLTDGEYGLSSRKEKKALFLDSCAQFLKSFYYDASKFLNANVLVHIYDKFEPNLHYCVNTLKIVNKPYLDYCSRKYSK